MLKLMWDCQAQPSSCSTVKLIVSYLQVEDPFHIGVHSDVCSGNYLLMYGAYFGSGYVSAGESSVATAAYVVVAVAGFSGRWEVGLALSVGKVRQSLRG